MLSADEQERLILEQMPKAANYSLGVYRRINCRIPLDDLRQYAYLGLVKAARSWDSAGGANFATYSEHRMKGAIVDGIRAETRCRSFRDVTFTELNPDAFPIETEKDSISALDCWALSKSVAPEDWQTISAVDLADHSQMHAALVIGISVATVNKRRQRALRSMRGAKVIRSVERERIS